MEQSNPVAAPGIPGSAPRSYGSHAPAVRLPDVRLPRSPRTAAAPTPPEAGTLRRQVQLVLPVVAGVVVIQV
ncbi:hypothetical protein ACFV6B_02240, partial [Streptomyces microflavus]|uniref:hypothetical protein n=1 Tax=Streptomyces microflavus TaxID=1919 RepID=UPI003654A611